jgi:hypothetical protein
MTQAPAHAASALPDAVTADSRKADAISPKDTLEHAWRYFELHAAQRMSMFNYFLVLFGLVSAGLAGALQADGALRVAGVFLGIALTVTTHVFGKLDERSSFLVKHAEAALREAEAAVPLAVGRLFFHEPGETEDARALAKIWTYGTSFRLIFCVARLVGILGAGLSLAFSVGWLS